VGYRWVLAPSCSDPNLAAAAVRGWIDQDQAERWLTAFYPELDEAGVETVTLTEEDRIIYGPMSLQD
jgi:hypothetical protein